MYLNQNIFIAFMKLGSLNLLKLLKCCQTATILHKNDVIKDSTDGLPFLHMGNDNG